MEVFAAVASHVGVALTMHAPPYHGVFVVVVVVKKVGAVRQTWV